MSRTVRVLGGCAAVLLSVCLPLHRPLRANSPDPDFRVVAVHVQDYAAVPAAEWRTPRHQADRLFAAIGARIVWTRNIVGDLPEPTPDVANFTVLILSPTMGHRK